MAAVLHHTNLPLGIHFVPRADFAVGHLALIGLFVFMTSTDKMKPAHIYLPLEPYDTSIHVEERKFYICCKSQGTSKRCSV